LTLNYHLKILPPENDMLTWLLDEAYDRPERRTVYQLTQRILAINFAAIHTSSMVSFSMTDVHILRVRQTFTQALYFLAAHPEYTEPLREEIESVIEEEGWTKASMAKMRKLDSFFRESQRLRSVGASTCLTHPVNISPFEAFSVAMSRMALEDFTFSDGTIVPKGQLVSVPGWAIHQDDVSIPFIS
jgi:hypothetical protein